MRTFLFLPIVLVATLGVAPMRVSADEPGIAGEETEAEPHSHRRAMAGAAIGGAIGVVVTYGLTAGVSNLILESAEFSHRTSDAVEFFGALIYYGTSVSLMPVVSAAGIWQGGQSAGGNANYGLTLLGSVLGGVLMSGGQFLVRDTAGSLFTYGPLFTCLGQYAGGLLGYHLSDQARAAHRAAQSSLRMGPFVTPSRFGLRVGLSGRF